MARIFAYIVHKGGVARRSTGRPSTASAAARRKDRCRASPDGHCHRLGRGPRCSLRVRCSASYGEVWKIANEALAYPNAELVRKALVNVLPPGSIVLVPHAHFGVDLAPGLSDQAECGVCLRRAGYRRRGRRHRSSWSARNSADR